jgi:hypothetical protein
MCFMNDGNKAEDELRLYQQYKEMAETAHGEIREAYACMAREALRRAAKLDPAIVAVASAMAMAKLR